MSYVVRVEHVVATSTAVVRRRAALRDLPKVVPDACGIVWGAIKTAGVAGAGRHVAVYLSHSPDGQIDMEIGAEVSAPFPGHGEVVASSTPAGDVATVTHLGPYQKLGEAHDAI